MEPLANQNSDVLTEKADVGSIPISDRFIVVPGKLYQILPWIPREDDTLQPTTRAISAYILRNGKNEHVLDLKIFPLYHLMVDAVPVYRSHIDKSSMPSIGICPTYGNLITHLHRM